MTMNLEDKEKWQNQIGSAEKKLKSKLKLIYEFFGCIVVFSLIMCFQLIYILTGRE
jgi:hypothetical protein